MTILITGGAGYIGSHTVLAFLETTIDVVVLDNLSAGTRLAVPPDVPFYLGDIGDAALLRTIIRAHGIDTVAHFAGSINVPESVHLPLAYYQNNTIKSHALISACVANDVRNFIFSSTAAVYGESDHGPIDEDSPLHPINPYGWSKLMTEQILRDTGATEHLNSVIFRYFNVAGADPRGRIGQSTPNAAHLLKVAIQTALGVRDHIEIFGEDFPTHDGTCIRDYIHVTDLADAHVLALDYLLSGGESTTLNCGYGHGHTVREVLRAVEDITRRELTIVAAPRREGDPAAVVSKADTIRRVLGWQPRYDDLKTIVQTALSWEQKLIHA